MRDYSQGALHQIGFMLYSCFHVVLLLSCCISNRVQNVAQCLSDAGIDSPYAPRLEFTCFIFAGVTASKSLPKQ